MRYIDVKTTDNKLYTVNVKYIVYFGQSRENVTFIKLVDGEHLYVDCSYQEIKDMIASTYGAEDEED